LWREGRFLERHVFPNGELLLLAEVVREAEGAGFETRDVESLREHYVLTLRHWLRRLEARKSEAHGRIGVAQRLLSKSGVEATEAMPLSRRDLYLDPQPELREAWTRSL
jgi:cyclopropane fatty-acyl-phospholipid synthase-like methyltransferase